MQRRKLTTSGAWADIRDANQLTRGAERAISAAAARLSPEMKALLARNETLPMESPRRESVMPGPEDLAAFEDANDACILGLVQDWSFDFPVSRESLDEIPVMDYRKLQEICAPAVKAATIDFSPTPKAVADQESPFGNSSGSSGTSEAASSAEVSPTPLRPTG